jgi:uncharacterized protein YjbI with pentapeptide repeats
LAPTFVSAADQLGSDQAPVRLAGLYALERLAHSAVEHRQTIVDVICAYLRMPYTPPSVLRRSSYRSQGPAQRRRARTLTDQPTHPTSTSRQEHAQQEQQVRLTAQNILLRNLFAGMAAVPAWPEILQLRLTGALLLAFDLAHCQLHHCDFTLTQFTSGADFNNAEFISRTYFNKAQFTGSADFKSARFTGGAYFEGARFTEGAYFEGAQFTRFISETLWRSTRGIGGPADFRGAQFTGGAYFEGAQFTGRADFRGAQFTRFISSETLLGITMEGGGPADFRGAQFTSGADFEGARFTEGTYFEGARFTGRADFRDAQLTDKIDFEGAQVAPASEPGSNWPPGWTTRPADPDSGEDPAFRYLTKVEDGNSPDT